MTSSSPRALAVLLLASVLGVGLVVGVVQPWASNETSAVADPVPSVDARPVPAATDSDENTSDGWLLLPIRSEDEWDSFQSSGRIEDVGGEGAQHNHSLAWSVSDTSRVYSAGDVHQVRRSDDGGRTWLSPTNVGLPVTFTYSLAVDPVDPDIAFVHADAGPDYTTEDLEGIYRTEDAGESWTRVLPIDGWSSDGRGQSHRLIAYDPRPSTITETGAQTWYVAVDSEGGNSRSFLYRSSDGGLTWQRLANLASAGITNARTMVLAPAWGRPDDLVIYLATSSGLWISTDSGSSFQQSPATGIEARSFADVAVDPNDSRTVYLSVTDGLSHRSSDGGRTFTRMALQVAGGPDLTDRYRAAHLVAHPLKSGHLYLIPSAPSMPVLTSHDDGVTWLSGEVDKTDGLMARYQSTISGSLSGLVPDPKNPDRAVAYARATLWRTDDGGARWQRSAGLYTGFTWSASPRQASFDPDDPGRLSFFVWDVSSVHSANGGRWFTRVDYDRVYPRNFLSSGDVKPGSDGRVLLASTFADVQYVMSVNGGRTWRVVDEVDGNHPFSLFHRQDPDIVYAGRKISRDAGATWQDVAEGRFVLDVMASDNDVVFTADLGGGSTTVYRSLDAGTSWENLFPDGMSDSSGGLLDNLQGHDSRLVFSAHPTDPDVFFTKGSSGDVLRYNHRTGSWTPLGVLADDNDGTQVYVRFIQVDPQDPRIIYVSLKNPGGPVVFRSLNRGRTWEDISQNLPRSAVSPAISVHPLTGDLFLGGTFTGIWVHPPPPGHPAEVPSLTRQPGYVSFGDAGPTASR